MVQGIIGRKKFFVFLFTIFCSHFAFDQKNVIIVPQSDTAKRESLQTVFDNHGQNVALVAIHKDVDPMNGQKSVIRAPQPDTAKRESVQTVFDYLDQNIAAIAPAKYIDQRKERNEFHRKAFAGVLFDECNNDGISSLLGFIKLQLNINYSMQSLYRVFWYRGWPLPDYYGFPVDPWKKEWWSFR
jgi:hypothetical protein